MLSFIKLSLVISGSVQVQIMFAMVRISDKNILAGNKVKHNIKHIVASNFISNHHEDDEYIEIIQDTTSIN